MVECTGITKKFLYQKNEIELFCGMDFSIKSGEMVAIMGPSGCGKSTLLHIIGGLLVPTNGSYLFDGMPVPRSEAKLAEFRNSNIGFILQSFALIKKRTVFYNICLPLRYKKFPQKEKTYLVAESLGIADKLNRYPYLLSRGECQRVAIARAIISEPSLLLADEPTSSLDDANKEEVLDILKRLNQEDMTVVIATHDRTVAAVCNRVIQIQAENVPKHNEYKNQPSPKKEIIQGGVAKKIRPDRKQ